MTATATGQRPGAHARRPRRRPSRRRGRRVAAGLIGAGAMLVLLPVVLLAGAGNPPCPPATAATPVTPTGRAAAGMFAAPLQLRPGRWYRVGATEYSGAVAASGAFLPDAPDSFAELSLLDHNPYPELHLRRRQRPGQPALRHRIRVANGPRQQVLVKRDIGYGQGPGQTIPYRIDVYGSAAAALAITKNPVDIALAPSSGTGATLGQLPEATTATDNGGCPTGASGPLPLTPGPTARILSDGLAAAPQDAPPAVKAAIAAGNQIHDTALQPHPRRSGPLRTAGEPVARL